MNAKKELEMCTCIGLYSAFAGWAPAAEWYRKAIHFFDLLGLVPNALATNVTKGFQRFLSLRKDAEGIPFAIRPDTSSIDLSASMPGDGAYAAEAFDRHLWPAQAMISRRFGYISFTYSHKLRRPSNWSNEELMSTFIRMYDVSYGICLDRAVERSATTYVMGLNSGESWFNNKGQRTYTQEEMDDVSATSRWMMFDIEEKLASFRDVYPLSLLSPVHLSKRLGDVTFEQWVAADSARGTLRPFASNLTAWTVPPDSIKPVRVYLRSQRLLPAWIKSASPDPEKSRDALERLLEWGHAEDQGELEGDTTL